MKRVVLVLVVLASSLSISAAQITQDDIARADEVRRAVARELSASAAQFDAALEEEERIESLVNGLILSIAATESELELAKSEAFDVMRELYMSAGDFGVVTMFSAESLQDLPVAVSYLETVTARSEEVLARLDALQVSYANQQAEMATTLADQEAVVAAIDNITTQISSRLEEANAEYQAVVSAWERQEEERRREEARRAAEAAAAAAAAEAAAAEAAAAAAAATTTTAAPSDDSSSTTTTAPPTTTTTAAPPPPASSGRVCPVDGVATWYDDWLAPRAGHLHQGVDMLAAKGTPLVAIESGIIRSLRYNTSIGGNSIWLRGDSGDEFYYAHLDAHAPGLKVGQRVSVGEFVGTVGTTGNAPSHIPHLHFEFHPNGGSAAKPHPMINELCG